MSASSISDKELKLDKTDYKILKKLQENGRITNLQLSNEIGLSPAPTLERVKKLEGNGLITGYHAHLDAVQLGIGIKALVSVSLNKKSDDTISEFKNKIQKIAEVVECLQITGNFDFIFTVMVKDMISFEKIISQKLSKIESIQHMQTSIVISTTKATKIIPLEYD